MAGSSKKAVSEAEEAKDTVKETHLAKGKLDMREEARSPSVDFMRPARRRESTMLELVVMITKETQTDWEWADQQAKQLPAIEIKEVIRVEIDPNKPVTPPPVVTPLENLRTEGVQVDVPKSFSIAIQAFQEQDTTPVVPVGVKDADSVIPEPYLELKMTRQETHTADTPVSQHNTGRKHGSTPVQEPWPPRSPLYGRPIMIPDFDELDYMDSPKKESDLAEEKEGENLLALFSAGEKLPHLSMPATLAVRKDSVEGFHAKNLREFQEKISEPATRTADRSDGGSSDASFANLVCEFCQNPLRPFPTVEQQRTTSSSELYCCDEYRKFVEYVLTTDDTFEQQLKMKLMGNQHAEPDSQAKKEEPTAKTKIIKQPSNRTRQHADDERRHRQELERHLAMLEKAKKMRETQFKDNKQVKTIQFQLSKYRCYEQGMVILPPDFHLSEMEQFQYKRMQAALAEQAALHQRRQVVDIEGMSAPVEFSNNGEYVVPATEHNYLLDSGVPVIKKYEDKATTFLILLADGTSTVFYPSGNIAITVSAFNGIRTFTAFDDAPVSESRIVALFMSSGFGTVYANDGSIRLAMTPAAGFELNPLEGTKRRRWTWAEMAAGNSHVHAPPFQSIFYHLNSYLSVRIGDYQDWTLTFFYKQFRCRFNVMAFAPFDIIDPTSFDMSDIRLVRLNKFKNQLTDSQTKLKAVLREINYLLGLSPMTQSTVPSLPKPVDVKDQTPRVVVGTTALATPAGKKKSLPGNRLRQSNSNFLPPLVPPAVEVD